MRWRRIRTGSTGGIRSTCGHDFGSRELASRFFHYSAVPPVRRRLWFFENCRWSKRPKHRGCRSATRPPLAARLWQPAATLGQSISWRRTGALVPQEGLKLFEAHFAILVGIDCVEDPPMNSRHLLKGKRAVSIRIGDGEDELHHVPAKVGITIDLYSHVLPGMQEDAAARVDDVLRAALQKRAAKRDCVAKR